MTKDNKINIKLEVCKDKTSGKLSITAHFNSSAPNVIQNKDGFFWMPTIEEKDLWSIQKTEKPALKKVRMKNITGGNWIRRNRNIKNKILWNFIINKDKKAWVNQAFLFFLL